MVTTTQSNQRNKRSSNPSASTVKIQQIAVILINQLATYFPELNKVPGVLARVMAQMQFESSFHVYWVRNGVTTSRGLGRSPCNGLLRESGFSAFRSANRNNPAVQEGIEDHFWAHSLGQCMGYHLIKGNKDSSALYKIYSKFIDATGIQVPLGTPLTPIFTDPANGMARGVAAGLMMTDYMYQAQLKKGKPKGEATLLLAMQRYLGAPGVPDSLGTTPEMRLAQIMNPSSSAYKMLEAAGIRYNGTYTGPTTITASTGEATSTPGATSTASTTPGKMPGCVSA